MAIETKRHSEENQRSEAMLAALERPDAYPHEVGRIQILETHASWIVLAGGYAYKIKKPVDLGFLDFSTLALRRHFCGEELRLNRRLAPELYLDVVEISGPPEAARIATPGDPGEVVEVAVRMRQFEQEALLGNVVRRGEIRAAALDGLAARVARFHAEIAPGGPVAEWGTIEAIRQPVEENLALLRADSHEPELAARIDALAETSRHELERLAPVFERRRSEGFVRECHGDMHLDNMILDGDDVVVFDGIEFSPNLRWIDTISEVAFTVMDLYRRRREDLGNRYLNAYLEESGDYAGLEVFRFYALYRALVRAKVDGVRLAQALGDRVEIEERTKLRHDLERYIEVAERFAAPTTPRLQITWGLSGSGKTTGTQIRVESDAAIRVRSDVERKRLHDLRPLEASRSELDAGIYSEAATAQTYERLLELAERVLSAGSTVIVDATFLHRRDREPFRALARRLGARFEILAFDASPDVLRRNVEARAAEGSDASEATLEVLERQLLSAEWPDASESDHIEWIRLDNTASPASP